MTATTRQRGRNREQSMVPKAEFRSYYGLPVLNQPVWKRTDIAGYFFAGGLSGAAALLAAGAQATGRRKHSRRLKVAATGAIGVGAVGLVHDLGKPSRFYNMLRVLKPSSPMSVGTWLLSGYGPAIGVAALTDLTGRFRRTGAVATASAAALGPLVSTYTAALASNTAVPAWHDGYREMPFVFAGSSAVAAAGTAMLVGPLDDTGPARRLAVLGAALELSAAKRMEQRLGDVAEPYHSGTGGRYMKAGQALTAVGLGLALVGRRSRLASAAAGVSLLGASLATRFGIFEAGIESAKDPKYTIEPQRSRLSRTGAG